MESSLRLLNFYSRTSIIPPGHAFSEIICLDLTLRVDVSEVVARPFPVDFVKIIGHKDCIADHSYAERGLHDDIDLAKENIRVCPNLNSIMSLLKCKFSTVRSEGKI